MRDSFNISHPFFIVLFLVFSFLKTYPQYSATGNQSGTVTTSIVVQGIDWTNPSNVQAADNVFATALITGTNKPTYYLDAKNWGFQSSNSSLSSYIPSDAVINGIEVFIKLRKTNVGKMKDNKIILLKAGSETGSNKARGNTLWPTTSTEIRFGSNIDLWGSAWTAADLTNSGFGIRISAKNRGSKDAQAEIDHILINVFFNQNFFYSKSTGNLELTTNWGTNTDGSGANPSSFTNNGQVFFLQNRTTTSLTGNLTISGTNSKMIIGNSVSTTTLTIPSNYILNATADITNGSALIINNTTNPVIGTIDDNTTVTYGASGNQSVQDATYFNLTLLGSGIKALQNSSIGFSTVNNILTIGSGATFDNQGNNVFVLGGTTGISNSGIATGAGKYIYSIVDVNTNITGAGTYSNLEIDCGTTTSTKTLTLSNATTNTGTLYLTDGNFANDSNLTMASGSAIQLTDGTLGSSISSSSGYDVIYDVYTTTSPKITSNELTGNIRNFTLQAASGLAVNLNRNLVLSGNLNLLSGNLDPTTSIYNLTIGGNFTNNATLIFRNNIISFNGSASQTINASSSQFFYDMVINNTSGIQLNTPATINHALTLTSGIVTTSSTNLLTLANAVSISGGSSSSYINGPLRHTLASTSGSKFFPIGKTNNYRPVTLSLTQVSASSTTYTAEVISGSPPSRTLPTGITSVSSTRYYTINCSNNSNVSSANVTLNYDTNDEVIDPASLRILKSNGADWVNIGGSGSGVGSGNITSYSFGSFSDFVLAKENLFVLPMKWITFSASVKNGKVDLKWQTANENNVAFFAVERSETGNTWVTAGNVNSNNQLQNHYSFTDVLPLQFRSFYRIRSVDIDGTISYSGVITVNIDLSNNIRIVPVTTGTLRIVIDQAEILAKKKVHIRIFDFYGRQLVNINNAPQNIMDISCGTLTPGRYILSLTADELQLKKGFIVQK